MQYDEILPGKDFPRIVNVLIEIPVGGEPVKYELDKASGALVVDRILSTAMRYPGNYGFIPQTLGDDGDPLDVLIASDTPLLPGSVISCRPVGVLRMTDEAGGDEKIIAVPAPKVSRMFDGVQSIGDIAEYRLKQIAHFFEHYKDLESGKWVKLAGWGDRQAAYEIVQAGFDAAKNAKPAQDLQAADKGSTILDLQSWLRQAVDAHEIGANPKVGSKPPLDIEDWYFSELDQRLAG